MGKLCKVSQFFSVSPGSSHGWRFLLSSSKKVHSGSALQLMKALNFLTRHLGLEDFAAAFHQGWLKAYQAPTNPVIRREASPLPLSFVVWLERVVMEGMRSPALRIVIGAILVAIWSSLRWSDMQWVSINPLVFEQNVLRIKNPSRQDYEARNGDRLGGSWIPGRVYSKLLGLSMDERGPSSLN